MKDGVCPKCGSGAVYHGPNGLVATGWTFRDCAMIPLTLWRSANLMNYVCVDCGYLERYVEEPADRRTIAENWQRVQSPVTHS